MTDRYLVCTDLDRTLVPNGPQPESPGARRRFAALATRHEVTLAYVTGRHRSLIEEAMVTYRLPTPDFVIGDVGTTLYRVGRERSWEQPGDWEAAIAGDWGDHSHAGIRELLRDVPSLRLQERSKQNRFKLSFYLPLYLEIDALAATIQERLQAAGIRARLVWSVDDITGVGLLDVLPASASKRHAIEALMRLQGFDITQTVFCGDSGNDLEVLASAISSVLVANARPEVQDLARELSAEAGTLDRLYIATGGFLGMNGNYAAGILEGFTHYHPATAPWFDEAGA